LAPIRGRFFFRDLRHIEVFLHCPDRVKDDLITLDGMFE
jgi:hypothetical protein